MRAISYDRFGPAEEVLSIINLPDPVAGLGEVVVKLKYSGVNPSDVKSRAGLRPGVRKLAYDLIVPHSDGSGVIVSVGAEVDKKRVGQRVWIWNGQWRRAFGTMAEYIVLPAAQTVPLPAEINMEAGAAFGIPGLTAAYCLFGGGTIEGKTVLISGGAGAVGHIAVQLAKWAGAMVIATASPKNHAKVLEMGADKVLDYCSATIASDIKALCPNGIDRSIEVEFGLNSIILAEVMKPSSTIAVYGSARDMTPKMPFGEFLFKSLKIDMSLIYDLKMDLRQKAIDVLHAASAAGGLRPEIDCIYDFESCFQAHEKVQGGGRTGVSLIRL